MPRSAHLAFVSAAALVRSPPPAFAQNELRESRLVTYSELDLNTAAGADTLIRRINNAAEAVCGRHDGRRQPRARPSVIACAS